MNTKYTELAVKTAIGVLGLLVLFLATKTITEVISWSKDTIYPTKTITMVAEGEALAVADIASFSFSVNEEGVTSDEAQKKATDKINKALGYLKSNGDIFLTLSPTNCELSCKGNKSELVIVYI